ncbi:tetratricopeptide repeat protein [Photobacterium makurazakiensis]|uniref:tetratricopeptide repeat protein n=1 Tax=Photobacterium makurazakiensis TaxID=2910234 RepID=UPI003D0E3EF2
MAVDHNNKNKPPRIRLVNRSTLVVLMLTSLWALWLVAPTKSMLIQLIERSSSPDVSLAFLKELYIRDPDSRDIVKQIIDNYYSLGQLDDAVNLLETILKNERGENDWEALSQYLSMLLEQSFQMDDDAKQKATQQILNLLDNIDYIPDAEFARQYADAAISLSQPSKGFDLLYPHLKSGETSYQELISLALQNADYDNSLKLQLDAFREFETLEHANALFALMVAAYQPQLSRDFITAYQGKLANDPEYLEASIENAKQLGQLDLAIIQSLKLIDIAPSLTLYQTTSNSAIAVGNYPLAINLLTSAIAIGNEKYDLITLHKVYRWQNDIKNAQKTSLKLLEHTPSETQLRNGIDESKALGDIYYEAVFYEQLVANNQITNKEYNDWLNATEKAQGTHVALKSIKRLAAMRPNDADLISHKARLYSYQSNHTAVIRQWKKLQRIRKPSFIEAERFANAYIMNNEPKLALNTLTAPNNWLSADEDYLEAVSSLAWETSNRPLSQVSQEQLVALSSDNLDAYRYINTLSPLTNEKLEHIAKLYGETKNQQLLLQTLQAIDGRNDTTYLERLLALTANDPAVYNSLDILVYRAKLAQQKQQPEQAKSLYQAILQQAPNNTLAVNGVLWLSINNNDLETLDVLYRRYKTPLSGNSAFWLTFASASQLLMLPKEASHWYKQILLNDDTPNVSVILNYAALLEQQEQGETAYQLRRYVARNMSDELLALEQGDISYRSLVSLFMGERFAQTLVEGNALADPSNAYTAELFQYYLANNQADNILLWQQRSALGEYKLPDWQQLSLAIQQKDRQTMERLLATSMKLPPADRNLAYQLTGQHQKAWQQGQDELGQLADKQAEEQLRRIHVNQHPNKTHSIRSQVKQISQWDITRFSLDYYAPHHDGYWRLGSDIQSSGTPDLFEGSSIEDEYRLRGKYQYQLIESFWSIGFDLADGQGDQRIGINANYQFTIDDYWQAGVKFGLNNHLEASELMTTSGQENILGFNLNYQPTARESVVFQFNLHDLSTRFGDDIGTGWDFNLRVAERFFFADPAWQIYGDISMQKVNLSDKPLDGINRWHQGTNTLTSGDFIADEYQRIALGQRVWHGEPGRPGATVPSPRYWFDSSLGYNVTSSNMDITLSAGLGWRVVGNDELYLSADWQSQDRNGDESLNLNIGYYYSF